MMNFRLVPTVCSFGREDLDLIQSARGDLLSPAVSVYDPIFNFFRSIAYSPVDKLVTALFLHFFPFFVALGAALSFNSRRNPIRFRFYDIQFDSINLVLDAECCAGIRSSQLAG